MTKKKTAPKLKAKTPKGLQDRLSNARKLGEREEKTTETLSLSELGDMRERVCNDLRQIDNLKDKIKSAGAELKAEKTTLEARVRDDVRVINAGKRDIDIVVEEWLTPQNEVIRVRADTGEVLGQRIAKMEELQEELFEDDDEEDEDTDETVVDDPDAPATEGNGAADGEAADFGAS